MALWDDELCTQHSLSALPFLSWFTCRRKWLWHVINTLREKSRGKLAIAAGPLIRKNITYSYFSRWSKGHRLHILMLWVIKSWFLALKFSTEVRGKCSPVWTNGVRLTSLTCITTVHLPKYFPGNTGCSHCILVRAAVIHGLLLRERCSWGVCRWSVGTSANTAAVKV